jgi:hypothetical protein
MNRKLIVAAVFGLFWGVAQAGTITINNCNTFPTVDQVGNVIYNCTNNTTQPPPVVPPPVTINCTTTGDTRVMTIPWGNTNRFYTKDLGGFNNNDVIVVKAVVPTTVIPSTTIKYQFYGAEWQDLAALKISNVSKTPCDFGNKVDGSTSLTNDFYVNSSPVLVRRISYPTFNPGDTVYLNIKNFQPEACNNACNIFVAMRF